jgi:hypothetical protein
MLLSIGTETARALWGVHPIHDCREPSPNTACPNGDKRKLTLENGFQWGGTWGKHPIVLGGARSLDWRIMSAHSLGTESACTRLALATDISAGILSNMKLSCAPPRAVSRGVGELFC